jgi:hypothetical protein
MNPIEHVWNQLGKHVRRRRNPPITTKQLVQALKNGTIFPKMICEGLFVACHDAAQHLYRQKVTTRDINITIDTN